MKIKLPQIEEKLRDFQMSGSMLGAQHSLIAKALIYLHQPMYPPLSNFPLSSCFHLRLHLRYPLKLSSVIQQLYFCLKASLPRVCRQSPVKFPAPNSSVLFIPFSSTLSLACLSPLSLQASAVPLFRFILSSFRALPYFLPS